MSTLNIQENYDVAIIIPAYNEERVVKQAINSIPEKYPKIICIDDGSSDKTAAYVDSTRAVLVRHPVNLGSGAALQTGLDYGLLDPEIEYFVTYDADGQHRIQDVDEMVAHIRKTNDDIVLGSRFLGEAENITFMKKMLLKYAVKFSNLTSGVKLTDAHNGLRVFNRKVASELNLQMSDFAHASEIIERIAEKKYKYTEFPVTIIYTDYSRSKGQPIINAVNIVFDLFMGRILGK